MKQTLMLGSQAGQGLELGRWHCRGWRRKVAARPRGWAQAPSVYRTAGQYLRSLGKWALLLAVLPVSQQKHFSMGVALDSVKYPLLKSTVLSATVKSADNFMLPQDGISCTHVDIYLAEQVFRALCIPQEMSEARYIFKYSLIRVIFSKISKMDFLSLPSAFCVCHGDIIRCKI